MYNNSIQGSPRNSLKAKKNRKAKKPFVLMAVYIVLAHLINIIIERVYYYFVTEPIDGSSFIGGAMYFFMDITAFLSNIIAVALLIFFTCLAYRIAADRVKFISAGLLSSIFATIFRYGVSMLIGAIYMLFGDIGDYGFVYGAVFQIILSILDVIIQIPIAIIMINIIDKKLSVKALPESHEDEICEQII